MDYDFLRSLCCCQEKNKAFWMLYLLDSRWGRTCYKMMMMMVVVGIHSTTKLYAVVTVNDVMATPKTVTWLLLLHATNSMRQNTRLDTFHRLSVSLLVRSSSIVVICLLTLEGAKRNKKGLATPTTTVCGTQQHIKWFSISVGFGLLPPPFFVVLVVVKSGK